MKTRSTVDLLGSRGNSHIREHEERPILEASTALVDGIGAVLAERAEQLGDNLAAREQVASRRGPAAQKAALLGRIRKFFCM